MSNRRVPATSNGGYRDVAGVQVPEDASQGPLPLPYVHLMSNRKDPKRHGGRNGAAVLRSCPGPSIRAAGGRWRRPPGPSRSSRRRAWLRCRRRRRRPDPAAGRSSELRRPGTRRCRRPVSGRVSVRKHLATYRITLLRFLNALPFPPFTSGDYLLPWNTGQDPERSLLPPSDRRCRLGRRLRSSFCARHRLRHAPDAAALRLAPASSAGHCHTHTRLW
jgi:hypothetical protein